MTSANPASANPRDDALLREIHELAGAGLRGEGTAEQSQRLERLVIDDPRARAAYVAYMQDTVTLEFWASGRRAGTLNAGREAGEAAQPTAVRPVSYLAPPTSVPPALLDEPPVTVQIRTRPQPRRRSHGGLFRMIAAAAIVAAVTVGWSVWNQGGLPMDGQRSSSIAHLQSSAHATWEGNVLQAGDALPAERLHLRSGFAEIKLQGGAVVVVEGPAEFEAPARDRLHLHTGQLTARVPPAARGFTVQTADARLVDLGTEFGVTTGGKQTTELHVFSGRVEGTLSVPDSAPRPIDAGAAARFDVAGQRVEPLPLDAARFARFMPEPGLWGEYFNERDLRDRASGRIDQQIDFTSPDWNLAPPGTGVTPDGIYSQRWTGFVRIEQAGRWTFYTNSNDGVRLWVGGEQLIERWDMHVDKQDQGRLTLRAGWHAIRLEHFQAGKDAAIVLSFSGPGRAPTVIPSTHLSVLHPVTGERAATGL